jgi:predicted O-methyltransferase YrrM
MQFQEYVCSLPLLHHWSESWDTGGFYSEQLRILHQFLQRRLPERATLLETGAGNSTIMMLFLPPARLISIAPEKDLFDRIYEFCRTNNIPTNVLEAHIDGSQWVLPKLAAENRFYDPILDFALIDGSHSWPTCFIDLEYINAMLKRDGYLMIDDVQLHTVKEIARLLIEQSAFSLELDLGKSLIFRKVTSDRAFGGWWTQPYIVRRSNEYARYPNAYALGDFRNRHLAKIAHWLSKLPARFARSQV